MTKLRAVGILLCLVLFAGCGGGGSGSDGDSESGGAGNGDGDSGGGSDTGSGSDSGSDGGGDDSGDDDSGGSDSGDDGSGDQTFSLQGTITASSVNQADSDTNEPSAPSTPNDAFSEAQGIINPSTVGGHVNQAGEGAGGATFTSGDVSDFYEAELLEGQRLTLSIADAADLDLYLFPESCADGSCTRNSCRFDPPPPDAVASSAGTTRRESLTVPSDGRYFVQVCVFPNLDVATDASNYVLSVGRAPSSTASGEPVSMNAAFVPGQIVVRFKDDRLPAKSASGPSASAAALGMRARGGRAGGPMLMSMRGMDRVGVLGHLGVDVAGDSKRRALASRGGDALAKYDTLRAIEALEARPDVAYAEPNYIVRPLQVPDDEFYEFQWHYPLIALPQAWNTTTGSTDTTVAVVDTGIRDDHPDFPASKLVDGYDFISDPESAADGDGVDPDPFDPGDGSGGTPSSFHGTHVAGTVGAASDNGTGVAGVSWGTRIMPLRALGKQGGTSFDTAQAVRYAADLSNDAGVRPAGGAADVINLSLGGPTPSTVIRDAVGAARDAGSIIVAAAGNDGTDVPAYPAAHDGVISVSAVDINENLAPYSNFGDTIDLAAPGGDVGADRDGDGYPDGVLSTRWNETTNEPVYGYYQGTSMAAPHVAGVLALMRGLNPELTPAEVDQMVADGALSDDLGPTGRDDSFGHGLINARKAVEAAQNGGGGGDPVPELVASPSSLNFGAFAGELDFNASNAGGGELTGVDVSVSGSPGWLSVGAADVDEEGVGRYTATVDRSGLTAGTYSADIAITSDANDVTLPIIMQVADSDASADAGRQFVLLIDADTDEAIDQDAVDPSDGQYSFGFSDVPPGEYRLITGTDMDNDLTVCDAGEACGAYASLDLIRTITIDADRSDLDFVTGFTVSLESNPASTDAETAGGGVVRLPNGQAASAPREAAQ